MSNLEKKDPGETCNARKTDGSGHCQNRAGKGTDHLGHGRCYLHGGDSPSGEKAVLSDLGDASEHAAVAFKLMLKDVRRKIENGDIDDVDWQKLDRMARTAFDRTDAPPVSKQELENVGDEPLSEIVVDFEDVDT